ncbi:MAG TPA: VOC family protein [Acidimicrobiales bacterium]|nr:VOC family protein [Acidimicrobiales bacterium]
MLRIDHVVLYAGDSDATLRFYRDVLGLELRGDEEWRKGTRPTFHIPIGDAHFINVHPAGSDLHPRAARSTPGGLDMCLLTDAPLSEVIDRAARGGVPVEVGPVPRTTATGEPSQSVYFRDPDGNLVEIMSTVH